MGEKKIGVGVGVMIMQDGKVLLGKRHENPAQASSKLKGAGTWTFPGGKLEFGEQFEEGASREVLEETGLSLNSVQVIAVNNDLKDDVQFVTIGLFSDDFSGEVAVREPDVITEWRWFSLEDLPDPMYFPSEKLIQNFLAKKFYMDNSDS